MFLVNIRTLARRGCLIHPKPPSISAQERLHNQVQLAIRAINTPRKYNKPPPASDAFQAMFFFELQCVGNPVSAEVPWLAGPRH